MNVMSAYLSIGDFSRATHMTVKTLRHYHQIGLLEPADVDPHTGYRRYTTDQLPTAQVIRRFRDLDMPLEEIQAVLAASDPQVRSEQLTSHLNRLEDDLGRTQRAVASLRDLLAPASPDFAAGIELRAVPATPAAAISEVVAVEDAMSWLQGALGELFGVLAAQHVLAAAAPGGVFADELFTHHQGQSTVFIPYADPIQPMGRSIPHADPIQPMGRSTPHADAIRPVGRVTTLVVPATELAVITHCGPHDDIDRSYATLATYVARHALAVDGPIREYYLGGQRDTADTAEWRTEIGWPVFQTGAAAARPPAGRPASP